MPGSSLMQFFPALTIAARKRSGVAGVRVTRTPVASWIALSIAGAVGISACSPTPLAPKGPTEDARSMSMVSIGGTSPIVGIR